MSLNSNWGHGSLREVRELKAAADAAALDACDVSEEDEEEKGERKAERGWAEEPGGLREPLMRPGEEER